MASEGAVVFKGLSGLTFDGEKTESVGLRCEGVVGDVGCDGVIKRVGVATD